MGTMQDFFYGVQELGKKIAATPFQMYKKKLSKMSDRQVVNEYWKQRRINPNSKEYAAVQTEITINTKKAPDFSHGDEFAKENLKKSLTKSSN